MSQKIKKKYLREYYMKKISENSVILVNPCPGSFTNCFQQTGSAIKTSPIKINIQTIPNSFVRHKYSLE